MKVNKKSPLVQPTAIWTWMLSSACSFSNHVSSPVGLWAKCSGPQHLAQLATLQGSISQCLLQSAIDFSQSRLIWYWTMSNLTRREVIGWPHYRAPQCLIQSTTSRACNATCLGSDRYTLKSPSRDDLVSDTALELLQLRCPKMLLNS